MLGISILLFLASLFNTLFFGLSAHNIFFFVISILFFFYTEFYMKKQSGYIKTLIVPSALILILLLTGVIFDPFKTEKAFAAKYNKAVEQIPKENYEKALDLLDELEKTDPSDDQVSQAKGILYMRMADYENSWSFLVKSINLNPYDINTKYNMALNKYHTGKSEEAVKLFEEIIKRAPNILKAHVYAATISMELHQYKKAIYHLENARFLEPNAAPIYIYLARSYIEFMDYDKAMENLETALKKDPTKTQKNEIVDLIDQIEPYTGGDLR